jgi:carbon-monoxide dehydrogenase medium subunit
LLESVDPPSKNFKHRVAGSRDVLEARMFPAPFDYQPAHSVAEAIEMLARYGDDVRVLAGGQSLIPAMRFRLARPAVLVDINPVAELAYLREASGELQVGAMTRDFAVERSPTIGERYRLLSDTATVVADPVVRQMGTVVGSLCHNDPAGDWPVTALASRARVVLQGRDGRRSLSIDDFLVDSYTTAVGAGEMAVEVCFPTPGPRTSGSYQKIERKVGDFATAAAAAQITLAPDGTIAQAGIAIGALGPMALRVPAAEKLLEGARPSRALIEQAMREAETVADPASDNRGSVEYKRAMAGVLVGRAIASTFERLGVGDLK